MKKTVLLLLLFCCASLAFAQRINEFHYDNVGGDVGEFIEVFIPDPQPANVSSYTLELYNGNNDQLYSTINFNTATTSAGNDAAGVAGVFYLFNVPGLQNGSPDGIALIDDTGTVLQFISYEGTMTPINGTASGMMSTDIGVFESNNAPIGGSVAYDANTGTWSLITDDTPGAANGSSGGGGNSGFLFIHDVQGAGAASPVVNTTATVRGIVTSDTQGAGAVGLAGFFVQEEDADADTDPLTSEGIFVYDGTAPAVNVNVGDLVEVTGLVKEFFDLTEMDVLAAGSSVTIISSGNPLPTVTNIDLPLPTDQMDYEKWEGMYVNFIDDLHVTEFFNLGRYGQVKLSEQDRFENFTECNTPDAAGYTAHQADIARRHILVDDNRTQQNPFPTTLPDGTNLTPTNSIRGNDLVSGLTGVIDYAFGEYRLQPLTATITPNNPRPATPPAVGGNIIVASVNVLNYFNGDGAGGGFPTPRGADDITEFMRQEDKIVKAICAMDADIIGLQEIENDGFGATSAIQSLIDAIFAECGTQYAFVDPGTGTIGTDEICVGLIYKTSTITQSGTAAILTAPLLGTSPSDVFTRNRVPLIQTFQVTSGPDAGEQITITVNHFKSKGSSCGGAPDDDLTMGQANCNGMRAAGAAEIANWLTTNPTGIDIKDQLIVGDLNAYRMEEPIDVLENAGFTDLAPAFNNSFPCSGAYSFVFDGQWGSLDHAMASNALFSDITGVKDWHVNADEPNIWDYNTDFNDPSYYENNVYRFSDHDPLLIGIDLNTNAGGVAIAPKVLLQGPLSGTLMGTALNMGNLIPTTEPYTGLGHSFVGGGGEMMSPIALTQVGNDKVVDWVIVEIRDAGSSTTVLASRAALVQADGDVVDIDGKSPLCISGITAGQAYYISIQHRNHLGVMTSTPVTLN